MNHNEWMPMDKAPRDGSKFDVKCISQEGVEVIVEELFYGYKPMRSDDTMILWGKQNFLSPYLTPVGWRYRS